MDNNHIKHQTCAAHTPEQNGIAESDHRTTVESERSLIHPKGAPLKLWAEAVNHSVYVLNRSLTNGVTKTPYEIWFGTAPDVSRIRVFGAPTYFLVPEGGRQKMDPKAIKGVYVGESETQKASRVFVETTGRTHITRHLRVYETLPYWSDPEATSSSPTPTITGEDHNTMVETDETTTLNDNPTTEKESTKRQQLASPIEVRRSKRGRISKKIWDPETSIKMNNTPQSCFAMAIQAIRVSTTNNAHTKKQ